MDLADREELVGGFADADGDVDAAGVEELEGEGEVRSRLLRNPRHPHPKTNVVFAVDLELGFADGQFETEFFEHADFEEFGLVEGAEAEPVEVHQHVELFGAESAEETDEFGGFGGELEESLEAEVALDGTDDDFGWLDHRV